MVTTLQLHGSRILVGAGLLDQCGAELRGAFQGRRLAIISDTTVAPLYAARASAACKSAGLAASLFTVPAGEASKTREQWACLTDAMLAAGFGRDSAILALGGGVVGDLAGFVAATYMRGIPFAQVPTSLLAMIDASIGGKTGVDTAAGKNLVGAFHHPALVLVDPTALSTLPIAHLRSGLAEAIKHAAITSKAEYDWLAGNIAALLRDGGPEPALAEQLVTRNIEIKCGVVARDERESGLRKALNFGHTIGHAIEALSGYSMLHGECVAIGMIAETRIGVHMGITDSSLTGMVGWLARNAGLPTAIPASMTTEAILAATRSDKKARAGEVEYSLPLALGEMAGSDRAFGVPVPDTFVAAALLESRTTL